METLLILLRYQQSVGERAFIGFMTGLFITLVIAISRGIKNAKEKNKKDWDEVSKSETNSNRTSDWGENKEDDK